MEYHVSCNNSNQLMHSRVSITDTPIPIISSNALSYVCDVASFTSTILKSRSLASYIVVLGQLVQFPKDVSTVAD